MGCSNLIATQLIWEIRHSLRNALWQLPRLASQVAEAAPCMCLVQAVLARKVTLLECHSPSRGPNWSKELCLLLKPLEALDWGLCIALPSGDDDDSSGVHAG